MNKKLFIGLWIFIQVFVLFLFPMIGTGIITIYSISEDAHYIETINKRAFDINVNSQTDFSDAAVKYLDATQVYEKRVWKQAHKEVYWFENLFPATICILLLQLINLLWMSIYRDEYN